MRLLGSRHWRRFQQGLWLQGKPWRTFREGAEDRGRELASLSFLCLPATTPGSGLGYCQGRWPPSKGPGLLAAPQGQCRLGHCSDFKISVAWEALLPLLFCLDPVVLAVPADVELAWLSLVPTLQQWRAASKPLSPQHRAPAGEKWQGGQDNDGPWGQPVPSGDVAWPSLLAALVGVGSLQADTVTGCFKAGLIPGQPLLWGPLCDFTELSKGPEGVSHQLGMWDAVSPTSSLYLQPQLVARKLGTQIHSKALSRGLGVGAEVRGAVQRGKNQE